MLTYTLVVFFAAIILIFSQELIRMAKKIMSKPGVKLLVPLALASWFIELYEDWGRWLLLWCRATFQILSQKAAELLPFQMGSLHLIRIAFLFLIGSFPAWMFWFQAKWKESYTLHPLAYYLGFVLWVIAVFLLFD